MFLEDESTDAVATRFLANETANSTESSNGTTTGVDTETGTATVGNDTNATETNEPKIVPFEFPYVVKLYGTLKDGYKLKMLVGKDNH